MKLQFSASKHILSLFPFPTSILTLTYKNPNNQFENKINIFQK